MKKRNRGLIVFIVILCLLVVGLGGYIVYDKFFVNDKTEEKEDNNVDDDNKKEEILSIDSEQIKDLYNNLSFIDSIYINKTTTVANVLNQDRLTRAFFAYLDTTNTYCQTNEETDDYNCVVTLAQLKEYDEKYFGQTPIVLRAEQFSYENITCYYNQSEQSFYCTGYSSSGYVILDFPARQMKEAKKVNNDIIITDYFVYATLPLGYCSDGDCTKPRTYTCYKDYNKSSLIGDCTARVSESSELDNAYLLSNGQLYQHTFKQNETGTYYWYSSEPVNK